MNHNLINNTTLCVLVTKILCFIGKEFKVNRVHAHLIFLKSLYSNMTTQSSFQFLHHNRIDRIVMACTKSQHCAK